MSVPASEQIDRRASRSSVCDPGAVEAARETLFAPEAYFRLAETFSVLGDPTRLKIIQVLDRTELCVHDLAEVLGMTVSAVSHQLRLLRGPRLVNVRKEGRTVYYSLDDDHIADLLHRAVDHVLGGE